MGNVVHALRTQYKIFHVDIYPNPSFFWACSSCSSLSWMASSLVGANLLPFELVH